MKLDSPRFREAADPKFLRVFWLFMESLTTLLLGFAIGRVVCHGIVRQSSSIFGHDSH
jgi:hypothetical protein